MTKDEKFVIFASSLGTVFEWYDFYIYGTLGVILAGKFFSGVNPTAAFIFTLLAFAAGFAVRPFGALIFGRLGDMSCAAPVLARYDWPRAARATLAILEGSAR